MFKQYGYFATTGTGAVVAVSRNSFTESRITLITSFEFGSATFGSGARLTNPCPRKGLLGSHLYEVSLTSDSIAAESFTGSHVCERRWNDLRQNGRGINRQFVTLSLTQRNVRQNVIGVSVGLGSIC